MSDLHINDFYRDIGLALSLLWSAFPQRTILYVDDICGTEETDEFGLHSSRYLSCFGALLWLGDEGYIRYEDTVRQEALDQAILTHRAFMRLSAPTPYFVTPEETLQGLPPSVRGERETGIFQLREALRSKSSDSIGNMVRALLI